MNYSRFETSFGVGALRTPTGTLNSAFGFDALELNTTGGNNTAMGAFSLAFNTTGGTNTAIGGYALQDLLTGDKNTAIGSWSGKGIITGSGNTILGIVTGLPADLSNNIIIADGDGNRRINVDSNGNTGIGTISPGAKLEINNGTSAGAVKIVDGTEGAGKVLTSDANGLATWANPSVSATTNLLSSAVNTMTSTVNGVSGTATIINSNTLTANNGNLVSTVNGEVSTPISILSGSDNGLTATSGTVQLGGTLTKATAIATSATNTLAITGLNMGMSTNDLVVADAAGILKKLPISAISSSDWKTSGNAGTNAATDFIGTTDNVDVVFKRNNVRSGSISSTNTSFGNLALSGPNTGTDNAAFGASALLNTTVGSRNVAVGTGALSATTSGSSNVAVGFQSLAAHTTGSDNIAIGRSALGNNLIGVKNVAVGGTSLYRNTGENNIAIGFDALENSTTGNNNVAVGISSLIDSTTGTFNTSIGANTGLGITTGGKNTIVGANVTGLSGATSNNIIIADGDGNRRINVISNGNTGIGTETPGAKLEINNGTNAGAIKIVDGTQGAGKVLTSDANGLATWSASQSQPLKVLRVASTTIGQTVFTATVPVAGTYVSLYVNGMRISDPTAIAIAANKTTLTYDPSKNGGYTLKAADTVVIEYM